MKVIIVGGGKLGVTLAADAVAEGHDVVVVDRRQDVLDQVAGKLDLRVLCGNGAGYAVQIEAGVNEADLFIAATASDELNMIAAIIAGKLGATMTIARVRNPDLSAEVAFVRDSLGISYLINPDLEAAREIVRMIRFPNALSIEMLAQGRVHFVELSLPADSVFVGRPLSEFRALGGEGLVCVVRREHEHIVPRGEFRLAANDHLHVTGDVETIARLQRSLGQANKRVRSLLIVGGGRITHYLLSLLDLGKIDVKVVEMNPQIAATLASDYPRACFVVADGSDMAVLEEEGVATYDAVLSLTGIDEENVLISVAAEQAFNLKTITKVNRTKMLPLIKDLGLDTIVTPQRIVADIVLRLLRGIEASYGQAADALYRLDDNAVEISEFTVGEDSAVSDVLLRDLPLREGVLIASIVRDGHVLFPDGNQALRVGDHVVVVCQDDMVRALDDILGDAR